MLSAWPSARKRKIEKEKKLKKKKKGLLSYTYTESPLAAQKWR